MPDSSSVEEAICSAAAAACCVSSFTFSMALLTWRALVVCSPVAAVIPWLISLRLLHRACGFRDGLRLLADELLEAA